MIRPRFPLRAAAVARLTAVVVFVVPPFEFTIAVIRTGPPSLPAAGSRRSATQRGGSPRWPGVRGTWGTRGTCGTRVSPDRWIRLTAGDRPERAPPRHRARALA